MRTTSTGRSPNRAPLVVDTSVRHVGAFRQFSAAAILSSLCALSESADSQATAPKVSRPIVDVQLGAPLYYDAGGDSWDPTWAEDDRLYAAVNDGAGFGTQKRNIGFNQISGGDPRRLTGRLQNLMDNYGAMNAPAAADGRNWKSGGSISIDGVLYLSVGMDRYVDPKYGGRQSRINASIIKSTDHGLHWARSMQQNLDRPMFPGMRFATPFFVHYGKDYSAATVDNADRYIYATSNNGFWDNGDSYILGRVARSKIGALKAADWSFYQGGDGMLDSSWGADITRAAILIHAPGQCGETGVTYLPALNRYVMAAWYYPIGNGHAGKIEATAFAFYESPSLGGHGKRSRPFRPIRRAGISREYWPSSNRRQVTTLRLLSRWPETGAILLTIGTPWYRLSS